MDHLDTVLARIARLGPRPWSEVVAATNDAFYARDGTGAGRRRDFLTSPEVGPLFGAVVAEAVDRWWRSRGEPAVAMVVEAGAGPGTLARSVLRARPACARALRWVLVDRSRAQRARHGEHLPLEHPGAALPPEHDPDGPVPAPTPDGPLAVSLAELPRLASPCLVVANELLDDLPFDLWAVHAGTWVEVRVGIGDDGRPEEQLVPGDPPSGLPDPAGLPDGARVPVQGAARGWLRDALDLARPDEGGGVVVIDYASTGVELARRPWTDWVRTYAAHGRAGHPLAAARAGANVTVEVDVDQLARVRRPDADVDQASWLRDHGLDELVAAGRAVDPARVAAGELAAIALRSRTTEAAALTAPGGLGGFRVLTWGCD